MSGCKPNQAPGVVATPMDKNFKGPIIVDPVTRIEGHLKIEVEVAENNLKLVPVGKKVKVSVPSVGYIGIGRVSAIIPSSNSMTHTFKIKVSFSAKQTVYPGMYATIEIE